MDIGVESIRVRVLPDGRMSRSDAAKYLGVTEKTLANLKARGEGPPARKILGRVFYYRDDLDAFVREGR
jgi:hypothetical protein